MGKKIGDNIKIVNLSTIKKFDSLDPHFYVGVSDKTLKYVEKLTDNEINKKFIELQSKIKTIAENLTGNEIKIGLKKELFDLFTDNKGIFDITWKVDSRNKQVSIAMLIEFFNNFNDKKLIEEKEKELKILKENLKKIR